jgi:protein-S-isoprenylcysteine O-methyltransferase Ste14
VPAAASPAERPTTTALELGGPYAWLRHPIYLGWVLLVFAAPTMTSGRLLFSTISTLYIAAAIPFEERGLVAEFEQSYRDYQARVRWRLLPGLW